MSSSSEELIFLSLHKSRHQDAPDGGFLIVVRCAGHFPKHGICRHLNLAMDNPASPSRLFHKMAVFAVKSKHRLSFF